MKILKSELTVPKNQGSHNHGFDIPFAPCTVAPPLPLCDSLYRCVLSSAVLTYVTYDFFWVLSVQHLSAVNDDGDNDETCSW